MKITNETKLNFLYRRCDGKSVNVKIKRKEQFVHTFQLQKWFKRINHVDGVRY